jgi:5-methylcytosine-specific restriction endonuclease McrA
LKHYEHRASIEQVLASNRNNSTKRKRLIEDGYKEEKCECCGLSEWMGKPIPLELHHKDFNHYNNSIENLEILCSNCHMQKHNYCNTKK